MAAEAARRGLRHLGITEHGPALPGACDPIYFRNLHVIPRTLSGVHLLLGAEVNIVNTHGDIDLDDSYSRHLSHVIAGLHSLCYEPGTQTQNTDAVLTAMHNPMVNIISHPGDGTASLYFEPLVLASRDTHTLLEINNSSLKPIRHKDDARTNNLEILRLARRYDVPVILGSDAHFMTDIANYEYLYPLLQESHFPTDLIVNSSLSLIEDFIGKQLL